MVSIEYFPELHSLADINYEYVSVSTFICYHPLDTQTAVKALR